MLQLCISVRAKRVKAAIGLLMMVVAAGCASLPDARLYFDGRNAAPVEVEGARGLLSAQQSAAILDQLKRKSGDIDILEKHAAIEQAIEGAVQHGEQNSHLTMAPQAIRDILKRIEQKIGTPETPVATVTSSGARHFLRQIAEASRANVVFLSHNEVPAEVKVVSQGLVQ